MKKIGKVVMKGALGAQGKWADKRGGGSGKDTSGRNGRITDQLSAPRLQCAAEE